MVDSSRQRSNFTKYAWFTLVFNLVVILWGVFLRASHSGDGCGQHWLTCRGEVVPSAPQLKTIIEFSHRITSSLDGLIVIALAVWAIWIWSRSKTEISSRLMKTALGALLCVIIEGLLGAGLVLTGNTAENLTPERPFWMAGHLVNTFILLALLTLTAWNSGSHPKLNIPSKGAYKAGLALGIAAIFIVG